MMLRQVAKSQNGDSLCGSVAFFDVAVDKRREIKRSLVDLISFLRHAQLGEQLFQHLDALLVFRLDCGRRRRIDSGGSHLI